MTNFQQEVYECKNLTVCANQNDQTHIACFIPRQAEKNVRNDFCDLGLTLFEGQLDSFLTSRL